MDVVFSLFVNTGGHLGRFVVVYFPLRYKSFVTDGTKIQR